MLEGTGKPARLDGYTAAGKSGTAQKIDPATGRYSATQYNSSFVGFAPVNNPAISILVVLDSPVGAHHGGEVGGPVFKRIAEQVLAYRDVPHDVPAPSDVETAKNLQTTPRSSSSRCGWHSRFGARARFQAAVADTKSRWLSAAHGRVWRSECELSCPNLAGESVRGVTEECSRLGLVPSLIGSGVALEQFPAAGAQVLRGSRVTVRFGHAGRNGAGVSAGDGN